MGIFITGIISLISYGVSTSDEYKNLIIKEKLPPFIPHILDNEASPFDFEKPILPEKKNLTIPEKTRNLISAIEKNLKKYFLKEKYKGFLNNLSEFWNNWLTHLDEKNFLKNVENQKQELEKEAEKLGERSNFKKIYKKMESLSKLWLKLGAGNEFSGKIFKLFLNNKQILLN